jgi:osmotically inducible protein OsmC
MAQAGKVVYTAKTHTTGGREHGVARSSDGHLNVTLSTPGTGGSGTNPEQMFAAGWSACFEGAMAVVARRMRIPLPENASIDAEVDLCSDNGSYSIQARLNVNLPGMDQEAAQSLTNAAHEVCPYSKAIRGNVDVVINVTTGSAEKVA